MYPENHLTLKQHVREFSFWIHLLILIFLWIIVLNYSSVLPDIMINVLKVTSLLATLQFAGFILFHITDRKAGLLLQGFFGGFVSSTMVFVEFTQNPIYKDQPSHLLIKGLLLATMAMLIQSLLIIFTLMPSSSTVQFLIPILLNLLGLLVCFRFIKTKKHEHINTQSPALNLDKPILWKKVIFFAFVLTALILLMRYLGEQLSLPYITSAFIVSFFEAHGVLAASLTELLVHQKMEQAHGVILAVLLGHITSKVLLVVKSPHHFLAKPVGISLVFSALLAFLSLLF